MSFRRLSRWALLVLAGGFLFQSSCAGVALTTAVSTFWQTIALAINNTLAATTAT
jgi:hypothetical protein